MSEWKEYKLGDIVKLVIDYRGKTPLKLGGDWSDSGYRALSAKNIKTGKIVAEDSIRYVDEELYKKWMKDEVCRGDILITSEAPFGEVFFWNSDEKIVLSQRLFDLRIKEDVNPQFVYYCMTTRNFQSQLSSRSSGTTVMGLKQPELLKCTVTLPPIDLQNKIAAQLSEIDSKIECNRKICANLEAQAQALFKHWFIDFAPFKDGKFVDSELGKIPEGWKVGTLGEITEVSSGKRPNNRYDTEAEDHKVPLIGASCVMGYTSNVFTSNKILLTGRVGTLGVVQRFNSDCWPSDNTLVLNTPYYEFVYQILKTLNYSGMNRGTSQPLITQGDLKKTPIIIPPEESIFEFENIVSELMSHLEHSKNESNKLSIIRDTLLPKLMSGQIKV